MNILSRYIAIRSFFIVVSSFIIFFFVSNCEKTSADVEMGYISIPELEGHTNFGGVLSVKLKDIPQDWQYEVDWFRQDGEDENKKYIIKSASSDKELEYKLSSEDIGYRISVGVKYKKGVAETREVYSRITQEIGLDIAHPRVIGTLKYDSTLTIVSQKAPEGWDTHFKWYRKEGGEKKEIENATSSTYTLQLADVGKLVGASFQFVKGSRKLTAAEYFTIIPVSMDIKKPIILGDAVFDSTLTLRLQDPPTDWYSDITWYRDDRVIPSDELDQDMKYKLHAEDIGRSIRVSLKFHKDGNRTNEVFSDQTSIVELGEFEPYKLTFLGLPKLDSTLKLGYEIPTKDDPIISREPQSAPKGFERKIIWYRVKPGVETPISAANDKTSYTLESKDLAYRIKASVQFLNSSKPSETTPTVTSDPTLPVTEGVPDDPKKPTLSGTSVLGNALRMEYQPAPENWRSKIRWYRYSLSQDDTTKVKEGENTYALSNDDLGHKMLASVQYERDGYTTKSTEVFSDHSSVITSTYPAPAKPTLTGSPVYDSTLKASKVSPPNDDLKDWTLKYHWYRDGTLIPAATGQEYKVHFADVGKMLKVGVYFEQETVVGHKTSENFSDETTSVTLGVDDPEKPAISVLGGGGAYLGKTLSLKNTTFPSLPEGWKPSLQWYRDANPIQTATKVNHRLLSLSDLGQHIKVCLKFVKGDEAYTDTVCSTKTGLVILDPGSKPEIRGAIFTGNKISTSSSSIQEMIDDGLDFNDAELKIIWYSGGVEREERSYEDSRAKVYDILSSDLGKTLKVEFRFEDELGSTLPQGSIFSDETGAVVDGTPTTPDLVAPSSDASDVSLTPTLEWRRSIDPQVGLVYYDVYLDTSTPPTNKIKTDLSSTQDIVRYTASSLQANTKYYWKVVAKSIVVSAQASSSIHSFTTGN